MSMKINALMIRLRNYEITKYIPLHYPTPQYIPTSGGGGNIYFAVVPVQETNRISTKIINDDNEITRYMPLICNTQHFNENYKVVSKYEYDKHNYLITLEKQISNSIVK